MRAFVPVGVSMREALDGWGEVPCRWRVLRASGRGGRQTLWHALLRPDGGEHAQRGGLPRPNVFYRSYGGVHTGDFHLRTKP